MTKLFSFLPVFLALSVTGFSQTIKRRFEINRTLTGYADSTKVYLDDISNSTSVHIDSTLLISNHFLFAGSLQQPVTHVTLQTENYKDYKFFWLQNKIITY